MISSREVMGYVKKMLSEPFAKTVSFILATEDEELTCICNFFCPLEEGDTLFGTVTVNNSYVTFITTPFVQIPVSEDMVKLCFIKALRGSGFGSISAETLYKKLEKYSINLGFSNEISKNDILRVIHPDKLIKFNFPQHDIPNIIDCSRIIIEEFKGSKETLKLLKSKLNPESLKIIFNKLNIQEDSNSMSVISYLSNISFKYSKNKDPEILNTLILHTELKHNQIDKLLEWWHKKRSLRRLHLFNLTNKEIFACKKSLDDIYNICVNNPFILPAIPYEKAKAILKSMTREPSSDELICGRIVRFIYDKLEKNAWTCTPCWMLIKNFPNFISFRDMLINEYEVIFDSNFCYLEYPFEVETYVTKYIDNLIKQTAKEYIRLSNKDTPELETNTYLNKDLTDEQKIVISSCLESKISMINAGAGTGKSSCIREIVHNLDIRKIPWHIGTFTGKATSRVNEIFGKNGTSMTLDKAIASPNMVSKFKYLILDESSMITMELFYRFIKVFTHPFRIIIVGDINQLTTIGWGAFMKALIISQRIPMFTLTINHRIANGSIALKNANKLVEPDRLKMIAEDIAVDPVIFENGNGFDQTNGDINYVKDVVKTLKEANIPTDKICIMSPWNESLDELNKIVQNIYLINEESRYIDNDNISWIVGDRVMFLNNNYSKMVMNGDEGYIKQVILPGIDGEHIDGGIYVRFKNHDEDIFLTFKIVNTTKQKVSSLTKRGGEMGVALEPEEMETNVELSIRDVIHSFACTVDKMQGSEIDFCIIFIWRKFVSDQIYTSNFVNINRLYTALTRTKLYCWLIGNYELINDATCKIQTDKYDLLGYKLKQLKDNELESRISHLCNNSGNTETNDYDYDDGYCAEDYD